MKDSTQTVTSYLRSLFAGRQFEGLRDSEVIRHFVETRNNDAFTALMRRHGPMVLSLAARILGDQQLAEDVFQATFLVLAREARALRGSESLPAWLHRVALRLAIKAKKGRQRDRQQQAATARPSPGDLLDDMSARELLTILDEELNSLPEKYRLPLILCHLEGLTMERAAQRLGLALGAFRGRLERARLHLRQRLVKRGLALGATLFGCLQLGQTAQALSPILLRSTVKAALTRQGASLVATRLAQGALNMMLIAKVGYVCLAGLVVCAVGTGAGLMAMSEFAAIDKAHATPLPKIVAKTELPKQAKPPALAKDLFGDLLPQGADIRLGTIRWRHSAPVQFIGFSLDCTTAITAGDDDFVRVWDYATGQELRRFGPGPKVEQTLFDDIGVLVAPRVMAAVSDDCKLLAAGFNRFKESVIHVWDVATGKEMQSIKLEDDSFRAWALAFAPGGKHLAIASRNGPVRLWNIAAGKIDLMFDTGPKGRDYVMVAAAQNTSLFAPDGKSLVSVTCEHLKEEVLNKITFRNAQTGKELHTIKVIERFGIVSPVFSPDSKLFAYATSDCKAYLHLAATGELLHEWKLSEQPSYARLAFAADSTKLYSKSPNPGEECIQEWDVKTGKLLRRMFPPGDDEKGEFVFYNGRHAGCLATTPDSKKLAVGGRGHNVLFFDLATGKALPPPPGHSAELRFLSYTPDGKSIVTRGTDIVLGQAGFSSVQCLWDAATGMNINQIVLAPESNERTVADGRFRAIRSKKGCILLIDKSTGKEKMEIAKTVADSDVFFFSPDYRRLGVWSQKGSLTVFDTGTGKLEWIVPSCASPKATDPAHIVLRGAAFSPDCSMLALDIGDGLVNAIELASGKVRFQLGKIYNEGPWAREPGKLNAGYYYGTPWTGEAGNSTVAFSPEGRLLAFAGLDNLLHVVDTSNGQGLAQLKGHTGILGPLAFAPDGGKLASASSDTTVLIWDARGFSARAELAPRLLRGDAVTACWADLKAADAVTGFRAIDALSASPKEALALLKTQLRPIAVADSKMVAKCIEQLESTEFKVRQKAQTDLLEIGDQLLAHLEKELANQHPLETKQRLLDLQAKLAPAALTGERLRQVRAIEVLERIGNAEARALLQLLAGGAPGAMPTLQAEAALMRLRK